MTPTDTPFGDPSQGDDEVFELDEDNQEGLDEDPNEKFAIEDGAYRARIVDIEQGESKAGNTMWVWTWAIVTAGKYEGRELKMFTAITPKAMFKLREVVMAIGLYKPGEKLKFKPSDVMRKEAIIDVEMSEYNSRMSASISKVRSIADALHEVVEQSSGNDDIPF